MDVFKSVGKKIFGKTMKKAAKKGAEKALTAAATKTGEHVGKKAGDKIVQMLGGVPPPKKVSFNTPADVITYPQITPTQKELDQMLTRLLSGGSTRKRKLYNY